MAISPMRAGSVLQVSEESQLTLDSSKQSLTPFVKWAGGKGSLLRHLLPLVPLRVTNYYEPFLGGGALFLGVCGRSTRFNVFLSDTNTDLINAYRIIKDHPDHLIQLLSKFQREYDSARDKSGYYYEKRSWKPEDSISSVARFVFLNKTCYNGLYRVNAKGEFNVPFGRYKKPKLFNADNIWAISKALRVTNARLDVLDYKVATAKCREGDFVYLDPPYHPTSKTASFTDYTPEGFSEGDQVELSEEFERLVARGCTVLLSNSETALTRRLYQRFEVRRVTVNRPISCVGTRRTGYKELIVLGTPR